MSQSKWMQGLLAAEAAEQDGYRDEMLSSIVDATWLGDEHDELCQGAIDYFNNKDYRDGQSTNADTP